MNLVILHNFNSSIVESCYVPHFYTFPGASTSEKLVYWIHVRIPLLQQHRHTGRNDSTTEIGLLVNVDRVSYSAITPTGTEATKTRRRLPGFAVAAPGVAGAEVCVSEDADAGVGVASAVSTASAFMPRKLYVPDGICLVDV
jgi:hypothetical protein